MLSSKLQKFRMYILNAETQRVKSFYVTLEDIAGFLYIKAVWEIEDFKGSCLGKRQNRVRIRDRSNLLVLL